MEREREREREIMISFAFLQIKRNLIANEEKYVYRIFSISFIFIYLLIPQARQLSRAAGDIPFSVMVTEEGRK